MRPTHRPASGRTPAAPAPAPAAALALAAFAALAAAPSASAQEGAPGAPSTTERPTRPHERIPIPPLRSFAPPKPERVELEGGAVLFLLEDRELPLIDLSVTFRGGSALERRAQAGLADVACEVLRSGGTAALPGDALDEALESEAVSIEVGAGLTECTASLSCLAQSFDKWLPVFVELLRAPALPQDKLDLARKQQLSALARRNDDPSDIARRESRRAFYGDATPMGWSEEPDTLKGLGLDDLRAFHAQVFALDGAVIGVVGDFDAKEMRAKLTKALAALPRRASPAATKLPPIADAEAPRVLVADRAELNQSTIVMGHLAEQRRADDADYYPAIVANAILGGGGFSSRLLQKVRTELGLAYSVYSSYDAPYTHRGTFSVVCQTKCESTFQAIAAIKSELARLVAEEVSADELAVAKESILQQLVFASESRSDVIARALRYELYGFPHDSLERFQRGVAAVTAKDVLRVAKARFHPDRLVTVIVGKRALMDGDPADASRGLGPAVALDVERPAFVAERPAEPERPAVATTAEERRALVARAIQAMTGAPSGAEGARVLARVKAVRMRGSGTFHTPQGPLPVGVTNLVVYPDKLRSDLLLPFGKVVQCYDGAGGWVQPPGGPVQELPASDAASLRAQAEDDEVRLLARLAALDDPGTAKAAKLAGREVVALTAGEGDRAVTLYLDPASGRLVGRANPDGGDSVYDDFREVRFDYLVAGDDSGSFGVGSTHALWLPFSIRRIADGEEAFAVKLDAIEVNPKLAPDAFARPGKPAAPGGSGEAPGGGGR